MPYSSIKKSVESIDNVRLNKQIVECYQLLTSAIKEKNGEIIKGHSHHPVYLFYKDNLEFLAYYGYECCREYYYRNKKWQSLTQYFDNIMNDFNMFEYDDGYISSMQIPKFVPYYMEGNKDSPNCIRTTKNVSQLFRDKLIKKWQADIEKNRPPKWAGWGCPSWAKEFLKFKEK
jgi:hypothetical protein